MKQKIKIATELLLNRLPEKPTRFISLLFSRIKKSFSKNYQEYTWQKSLIRICDFIIVRTNGNYFIEYELTNICNAQCIFCPYPDMLRTEKKFMHMSETILEESLSKMTFFKNALISFTPTTGDTLLHPEWHRYIKRIMARKEIKQATFFTNAIKLDKENQDQLIQLLKNDFTQKMSQIYFSIGGLDKETYKELYKVDRFELVVNQLNSFLQKLKNEKMTTGVHIHLKMLKANSFDSIQANALLNTAQYPFIYFSHSHLYYSNDAYHRHAQIQYYQESPAIKTKACSYLLKTRFAADGSIWSDGCVISEMPGDSSLKLGESNQSMQEIEKARTELIRNWETHQMIPKPCQGCTVYRCKK